MESIFVVNGGTADMASLLYLQCLKQATEEIKALGSMGNKDWSLDKHTDVKRRVDERAKELFTQLKELEKENQKNT